MAESLEALARAGRELRKPENAARLLGAAAALRDAIGVPIPAAYRDAFDAEIATVRAALGDDAFDRAWNAGRRTSVDRVIAEADALGRRPSTAAPALGGGAARTPGAGFRAGPTG